MAPTRVALALGAGGARGYAHIGVIEVLEERGYRVANIAGTSIGALIGGLHAAGRLGAYTDWVRGLTARQVVRLLDPSLKAPGAIRAEKILAQVSQLLGGALIESLPISFTAVATDLLTGKEVWLHEGPLDAAIRASIALPTLITPVVINGRLLADGGLTNPIPTSAASTMQVDAMIAVSLAGTDAHAEPRALTQEIARARPVEDWFDRVRHSAFHALDLEGIRALLARAPAQRLIDSLAPRPAETAATGETTEYPDATVAMTAAEVAQLDETTTEGPGADPTDDVPVEAGNGSGRRPGGPANARGYDPVPPGLGMLDIIDLSLDAMQNLVTRYRLAAYPPDLLITIPRTAGRTLDFHRANELIALGRQAAIDALDGNPQFPAPEHDER